MNMISTQTKLTPCFDVLDSI